MRGTGLQLNVPVIQCYGWHREGGIRSGVVALLIGENVKSARSTILKGTSTEAIYLLYPLKSRIKQLLNKYPLTKAYKKQYLRRQQWST